MRASQKAISHPVPRLAKTPDPKRGALNPSGAAQEGETRARLIAVATRLFAEQGFDGVSVRKITGEANANLGAVNYHFESKEGLIREVFRSLATPVNVMRLSALDAYEKEAGSEPLRLEQVAHALVAPAVRFASDPTTGGFYLFRLIVLARALPRPFMTSVIAEGYDDIFNRFVAAISRALPDLSREEVCWRYSFSIGSLLHVVGYFDGNDRINRLTNGLCDVGDVSGVISQLVSYVTAGLRAPRIIAGDADAAPLHDETRKNGQAT